MCKKRFLAFSIVLTLSLTGLLLLMFFKISEPSESAVEEEFLAKISLEAEKEVVVAAKEIASAKAERAKKEDLTRTIENKKSNPATTVATSATKAEEISASQIAESQSEEVYSVSTTAVESAQPTEPPTSAPTQPAPTQPAPSGSTIIFGDSRCEEFALYGLWPSNQVYYVYDQVECNYPFMQQMAYNYPDKVIFINGIDDMQVHSVELAISIYEQFIQTFVSISPDTQVYVHGVLAVKQAAIDRYPELSRINEFNAMVQAMCARNGWTYILCNEGYSFDYVGSDGIHFKDATFPKIWLNELRSTVGF